MRQILHWAVVALLIFTAFAGIFVAGEMFRAHMGFFIFVWILCPIVAVWLASDRVRGTFTLSGLKAARNILMAIAVSISIGSFAHYEKIRDAVGRRFVSGYYVTYVEDEDDEGRPFRASVPHSDHWYTRVALDLAEVCILGAWVTLPMITWRMANRAVSEASNAQRDAIEP
jgi:hypothetical protein